MQHQQNAKDKRCLQARQPASCRSPLPAHPPRSAARAAQSQACRPRGRAPAPRLWGNEYQLKGGWVKAARRDSSAEGRAVGCGRRQRASGQAASGRQVSGEGARLGRHPPAQPMLSMIMSEQPGAVRCRRQAIRGDSAPCRHFPQLQTMAGCCGLIDGFGGHCTGGDRAPRNSAARHGEPWPWVMHATCRNGSDHCEEAPVSAAELPGRCSELHGRRLQPLLAPQPRAHRSTNIRDSQKQDSDNVRRAAGTAAGGAAAAACCRRRRRPAACGCATSRRAACRGTAAWQVPLLHGEGAAPAGPWQLALCSVALAFRPSAALSLLHHCLCPPLPLAEAAALQVRCHPGQEVLRQPHLLCRGAVASSRQAAVGLSRLALLADTARCRTDAADSKHCQLVATKLLLFQPAAPASLPPHRARAPSACRAHGTLKAATPCWRVSSRSTSTSAPATGG